MAIYYLIDEKAARTAKEMNSYHEFQEGRATAEYRSQVDQAISIAEAQKASVDPRYHDKIDRLLETYARKLAANINKGFEIDARVPSVLIAGCSNFPVRKKEKQNAARHKNNEEYREIQKILERIQSVGMGGISSDDPNAIEKLQEKLEGLIESQEMMKSANAYYRKHKTLDDCPVLSLQKIEKLTSDMANRWYGRPATQPFESYSLQNNNAEIRRVKARIEELTSRAEAVLTGWEFEGGKVEINKEYNRLQLFFDGKPDEDIRKELKSNGFRWAPSVKAWQRQLTANAISRAKEVLKTLGLEKKSPSCEGI